MSLLKKSNDVQRQMTHENDPQRLYNSGWHDNGEYCGNCNPPTFPKPKPATQPKEKRKKR